MRVCEDTATIVGLARETHVDLRRSVYAHVQPRAAARLRLGW
jgi:hypothetical protein